MLDRRYLREGAYVLSNIRLGGRWVNATVLVGCPSARGPAIVHNGGHVGSLVNTNEIKADLLP